MYSSFRCGFCAKTRKMFGDSFQYINEIECHPQGENAQTDLCLQKGVENTPTWILEPNGEEVKRHTGFLSGSVSDRSPGSKRSRPHAPRRCIERTHPSVRVPG